MRAQPALAVMNSQPALTTNEKYLFLALSTCCCAQDQDERVLKVIKDYQERLAERTRHHMG